jgi:hypothetical protein
MYGWVWRQLPGSAAVRTGTVTMLASALLAALWFVVFPWAASHLPIDGSAFTG